MSPCIAAPDRPTLTLTSSPSGQIGTSATGSRTITYKGGYYVEGRNPDIKTSIMPTQKYAGTHPRPAFLLRLPPLHKFFSVWWCGAGGDRETAAGAATATHQKTKETTDDVEF